jgi:hypothetical protein
MLWFNAATDRGELRSDDGGRTMIPGTAFAPGEKPVERCAGRTIEFESHDGVVTGIRFPEELPAQRARRRRR